MVLTAGQTFRSVWPETWLVDGTGHFCRRKTSQPENDDGEKVLQAWRCGDRLSGQNLFRNVKLLFLNELKQFQISFPEMLIHLII